MGSQSSVFKIGEYRRLDGIVENAQGAGDTVSASALANSAAPASSAAAATQSGNAAPANTPRQFECTPLITAEQVKQAVRKIPGFGVLGRAKSKRARDR